MEEERRFTNAQIRRNRRIINRASTSCCTFGLICALMFVSVRDGYPIPWGLLVAGVLFAAAGFFGFYVLEETRYEKSDNYRACYFR